jgi:hypothetical protein
MNYMPNFPLLFEQIGAYFAKARWSEGHEKRLSELGVSPESLALLKGYSIGQQGDLEVAIKAFDTIVETMFGGTNAAPCLSGPPRIKT